MSAGWNGGGEKERPVESSEIPATAQPADAKQPESPDSESARSLLDQVLQATLAMGPGDEPLRPEELRTLAAVARRRRAEPLTVETVMELVQAVLRWRFRSLSSSRDQWERMTRQIAETMWEDPHSHPRLQQLFQLLCEADL